MFGKNRFWRDCTLVNLLILSVLASGCLSAPTDSIFQNQSISDGQTLASISKKFVLGFFSPGASKYRYVGIWHYNDPDRTVVWVANRNNPLQDNLGILRFDNSSNLIVSDGRGNSLIVAYGVGGQELEAAILDTGNFVLRNTTNKAKIIWQSFDSPTDTWLPEMNIALGSRLLTSWKRSDDPAVGDYSFGPGITNASQLIIWWNNNTFWTSARWNSDTNSLIPELMSMDVIPVSFQCFNLTCNYTSNPITTMTKIVLDPNGSLNIRQLDAEAQSWILLWRQPASCDVSNLCGTFGICNNIVYLNVTNLSISPCRCPKGFAQKDAQNFRKGCTRQIPLQCNGDKFIDMPSMRLPDNREKRSVMGGNECHLACLRSCSCTAYTHLDGCTLWHGNLTNLQEGYHGSGAGTLYLRLAASELESTGSSGRKILWIAVVLPSVVFLTICVILIIWIRGSKNRGKGKQDGPHSFMTSDTVKLWGSEDTGSHYMMMFSFSQIKNATESFSTKNELGEGGFGPVYKGNLPGGQEIAVKRLAANSGQGLPEFKNEILLIAKLQHRNLVGLLGCCAEGGEMLLVYEYMPNKSLDFFLFDKSRRALLDWQVRMNIIEGVAQGLIYLHKHSRLRIIHRDLKASNILLDSDMNPKISDFGMARIFDPKGTQANTKRVVGTYGYMAPEYAIAGIFSVKSDVFSYGVLLLEIISGMRNAGSQRHGNSELCRHGNCGTNADAMSSLINHYMVVVLRIQHRCIHVSLLCVQEQAADRPSMTEVVSMITNENSTLPDPKQPGFLSMLAPNQTAFPEESCSLNGLSITNLDGR